tara:strand:+ start:577 stop:2232 length:1656 start_codon:yes stop_codon:yes gene_type:complete
MALLESVKSFLGIKASRSTRQLNKKLIQARHDASTSTDAHWLAAETLPANQSYSPLHRKRLVSRSRYEFGENSPILVGATQTYATDFIGGKGPSLQITDPRLSTKTQQKIERLWKEWCKETRYRSKLWKARYIRMIEGETFIPLVNDITLKNPVKLNIEILENFQVGDGSSYTSSLLQNSKINNVKGNKNRQPKVRDNQAKIKEIDGIRITNGKPTDYFVANDPDNQFSPILGRTGQWINKTYMIHWRRQLRNSARSAPELAASLPLCALLRRYTLATVKSAETVAMFTGLLETEVQANGNPYTGSESSWADDPYQYESTRWPLEAGMIATLPTGTKFQQPKAEQPTTTYDEFTEACVREIVRPMNQPLNVALGHSGGYNMASGTLDNNLYSNTLKNDQIDCDEEINDIVLDAWLEEAQLIPGFLPNEYHEKISRAESLDHDWHWPERQHHTDPLKTQLAITEAWEAGRVTDSDIQTKFYNRDPEVHYENLRKQNERRKALDLPLPSGKGNDLTQIEGFLEETESNSEDSTKSSSKSKPNKTNKPKEAAEV